MSIRSLFWAALFLSSVGIACGPPSMARDATLEAGDGAVTTDAFRADGVSMDVMSTGGSGDGSHDMFLPWAGGPAYWRSFSHGPPSDPAFFPTTVWLQSPGNASRYAAIGINMFVGLFNDPTMAELDTLHGASVLTGCDLNDTTAAFIANPTIALWTQQDEPDNAQPAAGGGYGPCITPDMLVTLYNGIRARDTTRPVFLNFGQGVAWTNWFGRGSCTGDVGYYTQAAPAGDIVSFDIYPANGTDAMVAQNLWLVPQGVDRLRDAVRDMKPVWVWIETTRIDSSGGPGPTPDQTRTEVWMSLIHGAMGIGYFAHRINPFDETGLLDDATMSTAVSALNAQIRLLAPVLNTQSISNAVTHTSSDAMTPIDVMVKRHDGALYVFAVAMLNRPTTGTFSITAAPANAHVDVIGESRTLPAPGGVFHDDFAGYGVHLYRITW